MVKNFFSVLALMIPSQTTFINELCLKNEDKVDISTTFGFGFWNGCFLHVRISMIGCPLALNVLVLSEEVFLEKWLKFHENLCRLSFEKCIVFKLLTFLLQ